MSTMNTSFLRSRLDGDPKTRPVTRFGRWLGLSVGSWDDEVPLITAIFLWIVCALDGALIAELALAFGIIEPISITPEQVVVVLGLSLVFALLWVAVRLIARAGEDLDL